MLLTVVATLAGGLVCSRVFKESDALLVASMAPLIGVFFVLTIANWQLSWWWGLAGLSLFLVSGPKLIWPKLGRLQWSLLGLGAFVVTLFTWYHQVRFLDSDNWIHEPLIATYTLGMLPPVNPFSPELSLNGHYGRDLLMAQLTPRGTDPLSTVWKVNPLLQLSAFLALASMLRVLTANFWQGYLGSVMAFFGINVGFRVGLVDSFDGNNGVVYAVLAALFYMMYRALDTTKLSWVGALQWLFAGGFLGLYQLIYESHFGLLFLTGATLGLTIRRRKEPWIALLVVAAIALPLSCVEGGVFTDLAERATQKRDTVMQDSPLNPSQHVSLSFPKRDFLQVLTTRSEQQRVSVAYRSALFSSLYRPPQEDGYMLIFDPRFVNSHWLPLYLAPFTLLWLARRRHLVGLGFWSFGAWAYLVPGLVNFGPAYEYEWYRWEFAAGYGFAVALGISLAGWFEVRREESVIKTERRTNGLSLHFSKRSAFVFGAALVLVSSLLAGEKLVNRMIIDLQKNPAMLGSGVDEWRIRQESLGMTAADLEATRWMAPKVLPRERFLSNRIDDTPLSVWHDSIISSRTGAMPAGHAFSPISEGFPAAPPYYGDALYRSFWSTGDQQLLRLTPVRWLFVDLAKVTPEVLESLHTLEQSPVFEDDEGHRRQVFRVGDLNPPSPSGHPLELKISGVPPSEELQVGRRYPIRVTVKNPSAQSVTLGAVRSWVNYRGSWPSTEVPLELEPHLGALAPGQELSFEHNLVTPLDEGEFALEVSVPSKDGDKTEKVEVPFTIDYLLRLKDVRPKVELPAKLLARSFYDVKLGLTSSEALQTNPGVTFLYRLLRDTGEPVWELDRIPQPMQFDLQAEKEWLTSFRFMTPSEPGKYVLQLFLQDPRTYRSFQIGSEQTIDIAPHQARP